MSLKRFIATTASICAIAATTAMAGGPDQLVMQPPAPTKSIYLEGHGGYDWSSWSDFNANGLIGVSGGSNYTPTSNGSGGFTGGLDLGYNFNKHIALETGWFYLPTVDAQGTGVTIGGVTIPSSQTASVSSWLMYIAAKLSIGLIPDLNLYGKVGVNYRHLTYGDINSSLSGLSGNGGYWGPIFGAGLQYNIGPWLLGLQYLFVPEDGNQNNANSVYGAPNAAPSVNLFTVSAGYRFDF